MSLNWVLLLIITILILKIQYIFYDVVLERRDLSLNKRIDYSILFIMIYVFLVEYPIIWILRGPIMGSFFVLYSWAFFNGAFRKRAKVVIVGFLYTIFFEVCGLLIIKILNGPMTSLNDLSTSIIFAVCFTFALLILYGIRKYLKRLSIVSTIDKKYIHSIMIIIFSGIMISNCFGVS